jgi:hypothetical protein
MTGPGPGTKRYERLPAGGKDRTAGGDGDGATTGDGDADETTDTACGRAVRAQPTSTSDTARNSRIGLTRIPGLADAPRRRHGVTVSPTRAKEGYG